MVGAINKEYASFATKWKRCRDVIEGEDAVKASGTMYLPKPSGMTSDEYNLYKLRAGYFNATGRTLEALHGMMFRIDTVADVDDGYKVYLDNVNSIGDSLTQFISDVAWDTMQTGWGGVLVDVPKSQGILSMRDAEELKIYPYLSYYEAENIINWRYDTVGRSSVLSLVVLKETYDVATEKEFVYEEKTRYRVLDLIDGVYRQRVLGVDGTPLEDEVFPMKNGSHMSYIPFYVMPSKSPEEPMMINLANVNISWYRKSADYENGIHWTGVPTPYSIGFTPESRVVQDIDGNMVEVPKQKIELGGTKFLHFPEGTTQVGMLEFSGAGLGHLAEAMAKDEERMAILGARIISAERKGVEAAETAKIHRAGENSVLAAFANNLSSVFTNIITDYIEWTVSVEGVEVGVRVNTDYDVAGMSSSELVALVSAWQQGAISKRVLFNNLQKGEVIEADMTFDDMQSEIEEIGAAPTGGVA